MKKIAKNFYGISAFLLTPTKDDGDALDLDALKKLIDLQLECGVESVTVLGSTGGIGSFTEAERRQVTETAAKHINGRVKLIVGTGSAQTPEAIRLTKFAADAGADAALVVPITYWRLTEDELLGHYEKIAGSTDLPIGIYNNPGTTGIDMGAALIARIAEIDNVAFVKDSSLDTRRINAIKIRTKESIAVLNGNDGAAPAGFAAGAHGWFAGSCNIMPKLCVNIFKAWAISRDMTKMQRIFEPMYPICEFMSAKGYIRVAYAACEILGRPMGSPRSPIRGLPPVDREILRGLLEEAMLLSPEVA
jgi:4-hydroxy-tetrahydrodipicolinate synthase